MVEVRCEIVYSSGRVLRKGGGVLESHPFLPINNGKCRPFIKDEGGVRLWQCELGDRPDYPTA